MGIEMFLKGAPPMTRRQRIKFRIYVAACLSIFAVTLALDRWVDWSIRSQFVAGDLLVADRHISWTRTKTINLPNFAMRGVSVWIGNCSPSHFWGSLVSYREDDTELPREHFVHVGHACRDWANGRWILMPDVNAPSWERYWEQPAPARSR